MKIFELAQIFCSILQALKIMGVKLAMGKNVRLFKQSVAMRFGISVARLACAR